MIIVLPKVATYSEEITGTSSSPDTSFFYSSDDLFQIASDYGEEGRDAYIVLRVTFDLIYPIVYFAFLAFSIGVLINKLKLNDKYKYLLLFPVLAILFDYLENIFSVIVMYKYPIEMMFFATIAPYMTFLKWIFIGVSFISIIVLLVISIIKKTK
jgi:hypothetical protein